MSWLLNSSSVKNSTFLRRTCHEASFKPVNPNTSRQLRRAVDKFRGGTPNYFSNLRVCEVKVGCGNSVYFWREMARRSQTRRKSHLKSLAAGIPCKWHLVEMKRPLAVCHNAQETGEDSKFNFALQYFKLCSANISFHKKKYELHSTND